MTENTVEVFVAAFDNEKQAGEALKDFRAMDREGSIDLIDAAVDRPQRRRQGEVRGDRRPQRQEVGQARRDRRRPRRPDLPAEHHRVGAVGRRSRRRDLGQGPDKGFKDEDLKAIGNSLQPGTSAIIAIAEDRMIEQLESGLAGYEKIAKHAGQRRGRRHHRGRGRQRRRHRLTHTT